MHKRFQEGQSLVELLIGLGVTTIVIGSATYALVAILKTSDITEQNQTAGLIGNSLMDSAVTLAEGNWPAFYNLAKGSANHYFIINSPTTTPLAVPGDESVLNGNITNGLMAHWKFDEISSNTTYVYDFSGNGNLGALTNGPTRTASASCKVGACLSFDGDNDYIGADDKSSLNVSTTSISLWMKPGIQPYAYSALVQKGLHSGGYYLRISGTSSGKIDFNVGNTWHSCWTDPIWSSGNWYHVVATYDGSNCRVYVNSTLAKQGTGGSMSSSGYNLMIGQRNAGESPTYSDENFNGLIDDVRIYNRALSATEVTQLYNSSAFSRYFYTGNVNRKACGTGDITTDAATTCTGSANDITEDPSTQKITVNMSWNVKGASQSSENSEYITRWLNSYTDQTDWVGASGTAGEVTSFGTNFYDYSNISTSTAGSIKITGY